MGGQGLPPSVPSPDAYASLRNARLLEGATAGWRGTGVVARGYKTGGRVSKVSLVVAVIVCHSRVVFSIWFRLKVCSVSEWLLQS